MSANLPKTLRFRGGTLNHAGQGRAPGSQVYFDVAKGQALELYMALVAQLGPAFGLVEVVGNRAMPRVKVSHELLNGAGPMQVGDALVVGPIAYAGAFPRAEGAWRLQPAPPSRPARPPAPKPGKTGFISLVKARDWGFIRPHDGGPDVFLHASQLRGGATLTAGARVRFQEVATQKGLAAFEVWPAG